MRLDPVKLLQEMRSAQQRLVDIADESCTLALVVNNPALEQFLSGLRTAWKEGGSPPNRKSRAEAKARASPTGSAREGHRSVARVVRRRALADEPRITGASAGGAAGAIS